MAAMSLTVEELAARLAVEAKRRGTTMAALLDELAAQLPEAANDPLEAFIGSGSSGRGDLARNYREIRAEHTAGRTARDI
jgi:hypothetical protein